MAPSSQSCAQQMEQFVYGREWSEVLLLVEEKPWLCRQAFPLVVQGQDCVVSLLSFVLAASASRSAAGDTAVPLTVVDAMVTAWPSALVSKDRGGRLPLHLAVSNKGVSLGVVKYLAQAYPPTLQRPDASGNLPLHLAIQFASEPVMEAILGAFPGACQHPNDRNQLPLHLLCFRSCWDDDDTPEKMLSLGIFQRCLAHNPSAARGKDRQGRLPLHLAAEHLRPRWDVLNLLVQTYSAGLLVKDTKADRTPLDWVKRLSFRLAPQEQQHQGSYHRCDGHSRSRDSRGCCNNSSKEDSSSVVAYMQQCTNRERRKHMKLDKLFSIRVADKRKKRRDCDFLV